MCSSDLAKAALCMAALVALHLLVNIGCEWQRFEQDSGVVVDRQTRQLEGQARLAFELIEAMLVVHAAMSMVGHAPASSELLQSTSRELLPASNQMIRNLSLVVGQGGVLTSSLPSGVGLVMDVARLLLPTPGQTAQLAASVIGRSLEALGFLAPTPESRPTLDETPVLLPMTRAATLTDEPRRYLLALLDMDRLCAGFSLNIPSSSAALLDVNGKVLAGTGHLAPAVGHAVGLYPDAKPLMDDHESVPTTTMGVQDARVFEAFRILPAYLLASIVEQDSQRVIGEQLTGRLVAEAIIDLMGLLALAFAWSTLRKRGQARTLMAPPPLVDGDPLPRTEHALDQLLRSLPELIFRTDTQGRITFVNRCWETRTGYPTPDLLGRRLADLVIPEDRARVEAVFKLEPIGLIDAVMVQLQGRDHRLTLQLSVTPLDDGLSGHAGYAGMAIALAKRQTVHERLQNRLDFATRLVEVSPVAIYAKDTDGCYIEVNQAFLELVGLSLNQVLGKTAADLFPELGDRKAAADRHVVETGETVSFEGDLIAPDGSVRNVRFTKSRLNFGSGRPAGIIGIGVDVTSYRRAQQVDHEARDASVRAAEAKLQFESGFPLMAIHELRTPLASLRMEVELIVNARSSEERRSHSKEVLDSVDRISHVFEQVVSMSRAGSLHCSRADLVSIDLQSTYVKVMSSLQEDAAKRGVRLRSRLQGCRIQGVEFAIYTLMRNLIHNAVLHTPPGGEIHIEASRRNGSDMLTVDDSGPGIPVDQRERAFDRFNRLGQHKVNGSGLGLSIVKTIAAMHGAEVSLETSPLGGLRAAVEFPHNRRGMPSFLDTTLTRSSSDTL